jgi:hypothetical protein
MYEGGGDVDPEKLRRGCPEKGVSMFSDLKICLKAVFQSSHA